MKNEVLSVKDSLYKNGYVTTPKELEKRSLFNA